MMCWIVVVTLLHAGLGLQLGDELGPLLLSLLGFYSLEHLQRPSGTVLMPHASCSSFIGFYILQTVGTSSGQTPKIRSF